MHGALMRKVPATPATQAAPELFVEVRGLRNRFGTQQVHDDLELDLRAGEILGVVGGSGTGKSVLMRTILGLRRPDAGSVRLFGSNLRDVPAAQRVAIERRCGVLFQNGALFSSLTVSENVCLPLLEHTHLSRRDTRRVAALKIALTGLGSGVGDKFPSELSGGMRKRAGLARALALDPDIVFLDEPTSGLDPIAADAFDRLIRTLHDALGLTVFMITHDLDSLHAVADRVAVLARGRIIVADKLDVVERFDDPWIREYVHGARGRAAQTIPALS